MHVGFTFESPNQELKILQKHLNQSVITNTERTKRLYSLILGIFHGTAINELVKINHALNLK